MLNKQLRKCSVLILLSASLILAGLATAAAAAPVLVISSTPDRGIQPRLLNDEKGGVHLLYFRKRIEDPRNREGDLYYRQYHQDSASWSVAVRVSLQSFSHLDAIGRAAFAIDGDGAIHVVWYQDRPTAEYYYTRSNAGRTGFEPQRSIVEKNLSGLDAGADIAADGKRVAIVWAAGDLLRENERTVFSRVSLDGGNSFGEELQVGDPALGACACCSLTTAWDNAGNQLLAYRSAIDNGGRHMQLLTVPSDGQAGVYRDLHPLHQWELYACPVTTNQLLKEQGHGNWLVFENHARIIMDFVAQEPTGTNLDAPLLVADALSETRQKNPAIAINRHREKLVVWGEAISYTRGGALNLQVFAADNEVVEVLKPALNIPDFSFPAAAVLNDDSFLILY
jgi:hypothetical protein